GRLDEPVRRPHRPRRRRPRLPVGDRRGRGRRGSPGLPRLDPRAVPAPVRTRGNDRRAAGRARGLVPSPVVVSYGSSPHEKRDGHELLWHLWRAAADCLDRAGVDKNDLDGLALASFGYGPGNVVTLGEHFGLRLRWAEQGAFGGASGVVALAHAADAVRAG